MKRLIYAELKKVFQIKTIAITVLILSIFMSILLLSNQEYENRNIQFLAQNVYTGSYFYSASSDDEANIESLIENYHIDKKMTMEEIRDAYYDLKEYTLGRYDAVMNLDFERYNQLKVAYWENTQIAMFIQGTTEGWGEVSEHNDQCQGVVICDSYGRYPLQPKDLDTYILVHHVYPKEYKQASDYFLEYVTSYQILLVPLLGIFMSYLALNQEKKEESDKQVWALPFSKIQIFLSKIIVLFIVSAVILLISDILIYLICGIFRGFHSSWRLVVLITSFLNGGGNEAVNQYSVWIQWQLNLFMIVLTLFTLFISIVICQFLSLYIRNKKFLFIVSIFLILGLPYVLGEVVQGARYQKYSYLLIPFYFIYTLLPFYMPLTIAPSNGVYFMSANHPFLISSLTPYNIVFKEMNIMMGIGVGMMTIVVLLLVAYLTLKRKDLLK